MLSSIITILGGAIAASTVIIQRKPNAQELFDKIIPYQGWIGVVLTFWGVWGIIQSFITIDSIGLWWSIRLAISVAEFVVGFLLAYGLISKYTFSKSESAMENGQQLQRRLLKYQIPAGFILMALAIASIVLPIIL